VAPTPSQQEVRNVTIARHPSNQNRITPSTSRAAADELGVTAAGDDSARG
jgi:hypothetical protein